MEESLQRFTENRISRRNFLSYAWWTAAGLLSSEALAAVMLSLWPKMKPGAFGSKFRIPIQSLPSKVGEIDDTFLRTGRFYITRLPNGILASYRKCTHLGCVTPWRADEPSEDDLASKGRFNCPCHGSIFDRYGLVRGGPAPRPLDLFPITIEGNEIVVDTGTVIQRAAFDESQLLEI